MKIKLFSIFLIFLCSCNLFSQIYLNTPNDAVNLGLENAEEYKLEKLSVLTGIKLAKYSIADFLPSFSLGLTESDGRKYDSSDSRTKSLQFGITQTVFNGGKSKLSYDMSKLSASFQYSLYEQDVKSFSVNIIKNYFDYVTQREKLKVKSNLLSNAQEQLNITKAEYEHGLILESDYLEYEISVMQIKNEVKQLERDINTLLRSFKVLLGLPLEANLVINSDNKIEDEKDFFLEPYTNFLLAIALNSNLELNQQKISLDYSKKQLAYNKRFYLPTVTLEGNVSFSGEQYPLTEPNYSIKLGINFSELPFFPINFSESYGFNNNGFNNISNVANASLKPDFTYPISNVNSDLSIKKSMLDYKMKIQSLKEDVISKISLHDDYLDSIKIIRETLNLHEKRLVVCKAEVNKGERKRLDYLEDLEEYAEELIKLTIAQNNLISSWYELELLTNIPLGELKNVCSSSKI